MGADYDFAFAYVLTALIWGLSVGVVYLHASISRRVVWFWTLIAVIPFFGIIAYLIFCWIEDSARERAKAKKTSERRGTLIAWPKTEAERKKYDTIGILANFRDQEVEDMILNTLYDEARGVIRKRLASALSTKDKTAVETYHYYLGLIDDIINQDVVPELLMRYKGIRITAKTVAEIEELPSGTRIIVESEQGETTIDPFVDKDLEERDDERRSFLEL